MSRQERAPVSKSVRNTQLEARGSCLIPLAVRVARMLSQRAAAAGQPTVYLSVEAVLERLSAHPADARDALLTIEVDAAPSGRFRIVSLDNVADVLERLDREQRPA